jgi:hypothetical protein
LHEQTRLPPDWRQRSPGRQVVALQEHKPPTQSTPLPLPHWLGAPQPQRAAEQTESPCAVQSLSQPPHRVGSESVLVSQPLSLPLPLPGIVQFARPSTQLDEHPPPWHSTDATPVAEQVRPHAPQ